MIKEKDDIPFYLCFDRIIEANPMKLHTLFYAVLGGSRLFEVFVGMIDGFLG